MRIQHIQSTRNSKEIFQTGSKRNPEDQKLLSLEFNALSPDRLQEIKYGEGYEKGQQLLVEKQKTW
jgi:hypothetical protein